MLMAPSVLLVTCPPEDSTTWRRGVLSKEQRRWMASLPEVKKVVLTSRNTEGLRKDLGHMELMGFAVSEIKVFSDPDQPMSMQTIAVAVLVRK
jgi:hypothetical protein